jgi:hypothetical protein
MVRSSSFSLHRYFVLITTRSIRATGYVTPSRSGWYTFSTVSDDGSKLWVNNRFNVNNWGYHGARRRSGGRLYLHGEFYVIIAVVVRESQTNIYRRRRIVWFRSWCRRPPFSPRSLPIHRLVCFVVARE